MSNTVRAQMTLSFRGETHQLAATIDLDRLIGDSGDPPDFHGLLARAGGIDPYSYLYEVVEAHPITFTAPTGIASRSCRDGRFDWEQFERDWREEGELAQARAIAEETLGISDLEARPELKAALLAAYRAGKGDAEGAR